MQKWSKHPKAAIKVAFVLFDQFSNMCLANCLEPMRLRISACSTGYF
ncbi:MAG: hypothetical protein ACPH3E_04900 [Paracoccaceae bacterium]